MGAASAVVAAFNLVCAIQGVYIDRKFEDGPDFSIDYRVDLEEGRFCVGACSETKPIASVTATDIFLMAERDAEGRNVEFIRISRESGVWIWVLGESPGEWRTIGVCERQPFSGFPRLRF